MKFLENRIIMVLDVKIAIEGVSFTRRTHGNEKKDGVPVGAAVNYTCSGSFPSFSHRCGQKREINATSVIFTRRCLCDEAILLAVRVAAFRIDFSAILLRVVHSPA